MAECSILIKKQNKKNDQIPLSFKNAPPKHLGVSKAATKLSFPPHCNPVHVTFN